MLFPEDYPPQRQQLPRFLAEQVMAQVEDPANLARPGEQTSSRPGSARHALVPIDLRRPSGTAILTPLGQQLCRQARD